MALEIQAPPVFEPAFDKLPIVFFFLFLGGPARGVVGCAVLPDAALDVERKLR
jgi:hypothetical protein